VRIESKTSFSYRLSRICLSKYPFAFACQDFGVAVEGTVSRDVAVEGTVPRDVAEK